MNRKRLLWILFFTPGILVGLIFLLGLDDDIVYAYRDYQHEKWLEEWLKTAVHTAEPNAYHFPDTISVEYLGEKRDLEIFLPKDYATNDTTRYPVLYFFDGDNLFDELVSLGTEWQVDEVINRVDSAGGPACIVVGIPSGEHRMTEYKPYEAKDYEDDRPVSGQAHMEWYATDLKKWVDANYRTLPDPNNTGIGGCSLGGLMAYYGLMSYPEVYRRGIIFSPSFWVDMDKVKELHKNHPDLSTVRMFINAGELETPTVNDAAAIRDLLFADGLPQDNMYFDVEPEEGHWHMTWQKGFKKAYPWILE
ncbi:MAG: alpha/beta hydrolase-fold protein [Bacteroidota bacterium]